jgi:hypothetical protein
MKKIECFETSWGSIISPYVQRTIAKRISMGDNIQQILDEELEGLLDHDSDQYDEANEIFCHCEKIANDEYNQTA